MLERGSSAQDKRHPHLENDKRMTSRNQDIGNLGKSNYHEGASLHSTHFTYSREVNTMAIEPRLKHCLTPMSLLLCASLIAVGVVGVVGCKPQSERSNVDSFRGSKGWVFKKHNYMIPYSVALDGPDSEFAGANAPQMKKIPEDLYERTGQCWYYTEGKETYNLKTPEGQQAAFAASKPANTHYLNMNQVFDLMKKDPSLKGMHDSILKSFITLYVALKGGALGLIASGSTASILGAGMAAITVSGGVATTAVTAGAVGAVATTAIGVCAAAAPVCIMAAGVGVMALGTGAGAFVGGKLSDAAIRKLSEPDRQKAIREAINSIEQEVKVSFDANEKLFKALAKATTTLGTNKPCPTGPEVAALLRTSGTSASPNP